MRLCRSTDTGNKRWTYCIAKDEVYPLLATVFWEKVGVKAIQTKTRIAVAYCPDMYLPLGR